jgi:alpha-beta hydrolase superfamily lysophospholipase
LTTSFLITEGKPKLSSEQSIIKPISFKSDGFKLNGILHLPRAPRPPVVIGSHGLYSSSNSPKQIALARYCNRLGIGYFRFDHRGCGASEGNFEAITSLDARCKDLSDAAAIMLRSEDTGSQIGLFGSSMGGTVCLNVANDLRADVLVTFAAPICSRIGQKGSPGNEITDIPEIFLDHRKRAFDIRDKLPNIGNILIFHGDADMVVPISHAEEIYKWARQPKKMIRQTPGDHPMSNPAHQKVFVREASQWFKQGLQP